MNKKNIVFFSGMARSGSHLVSDILNQNPNFHSEGLSPLLDIVWNNVNVFSSEKIQNELMYFNRDSFDFCQDTVEFIVENYYKNVSKDMIVFDKNRSWPLPQNIKIIETFINKNPKIVICKRRPRDAAISFIKSCMDSGYTQEDSEEVVLNLSDDIGTNPFMRPLAVTIFCNLENRDKENYFFIDYDDLIDNHENIFSSLYNFLNVDPYQHDFINIEESYRENTDFALPGLINFNYNKISRRKTQLILSEKAEKKISHIEYIYKISESKTVSEIEKEKIYEFCHQNTIK